MKKWTGLLGVLLVAAAVAVTGLTARAQDSTIEEAGFAGNVVSVTDTLLVLDTASGEVSILLPADYDLRTPGSEQTAGTLEAGARVAVLATKTVEDEWEALIVLVKPIAPTIEPVTGAVVSVVDGVITIIRPDGTTITVELPPNAVGPALGQVVTVFRNRQQEIPGAVAPATGIMTAEQLRERLRLQIDKLLVEDPLRTQDQERIRAQLLTKLAVALETHERERLQLLQQICDQNCDGQPVAVANAIRNQIQTVQQQKVQNDAQIAAANGKAQDINNQQGGDGQNGGDGGTGGNGGSGGSGGSGGGGG